MAHTNQKKSSSKRTGNNERSAMPKSKIQSGKKGGQSSSKGFDNNEENLMEDTSMEDMADDYNNPDDEGVRGSSL